MNSSDAEQEHRQYQQGYFDSHYEFFTQPIPADIDNRTALIVSSAKLSAGGHILDVGTGVGVLVKHFLDQGIPAANIIGCDLSEKMLEQAKQRYPETTFWQGDFKDFPTTFQKFEAIFFNACFGNFYDQDQTVQRAIGLLKPGGAIVISHPLGNNFIAQLKEQDPRLVLALLPDKAKLQSWQRLGLTIAKSVDAPDFYLAILRKG